MWTEVIDWLTERQELIRQIGNVSLIVIVITVVALPAIVKYLPVDYFVSERREPAWREKRYPLFWRMITLAKNLLGLILILFGIAMLLLPGQGAVTILIGLAISNFPGKYALERRIASQPAVGATLNKLRELTGAPPFLLEFEAKT
jgi:hypothetical protein